MLNFHPSRRPFMLFISKIACQLSFESFHERSSQSQPARSDTESEDAVHHQSGNTKIACRIT